MYLMIKVSQYINSAISDVRFKSIGDCACRVPCLKACNVVSVVFMYEQVLLTTSPPSNLHDTVHGSNISFVSARSFP